MAERPDQFSDVKLAAFERQCLTALNELFEAARSQEELQFAMALSPEFRGAQEGGWSTAVEATKAFDEYLDLISKIPPSPIRVRVALSFYSYLSECAGLYEVPMNMMRITSKQNYAPVPFHGLITKFDQRGVAIAPNANKVMRAMLGHAEELNFIGIKNILLDAFDSDLRNGYAHADYVVRPEGIRLPRRNGGPGILVKYDDFEVKFNKAIRLFQVLRELISSSAKTYVNPKVVTGRMNDQAPPVVSTISFDEKTEVLRIQSRSI
ncbi:MAG: hypothetical protein KG075_16300 [Alphaproteobacteria bacterium]|nr:hypothetical protein [Alphaproteobacteria bacterium]